MSWSWRIARVAGIGIYIHATFILLLAWIGLGGYRYLGMPDPVAGLLFIAAIFATVVLHELGHALAARRFGVPTRDITLLPIGGVARLERMPREPKQELLIALAGPAVNVVLAVLLYVALAATGGVRSAVEVLAEPGGAFFGRGLLARLFSWNVVIVLFNMIPAFPMDGGRVLRAGLAWRSGDYARATEIAARVGRFFALVFGFVGFFYLRDPILVFIALFVWMGAAGEAAAVRTTASLEGVPTGRVMITDVRTVAPHDPLAHVVQLILAGFQQDFPVVENGNVVGVLTRSALLKALAERGEAQPVAAVMHRDFQVVSPEEPVEHALARLRACNCHVLPVVRGRELLGVLTLDNVGEFIMVETARAGSASESESESESGSAGPYRFR